MKKLLPWNWNLNWGRIGKVVLLVFLPIVLTAGADIYMNPRAAPISLGTDEMLLVSDAPPVDLAFLPVSGMPTVFTNTEAMRPFQIEKRCAKHPERLGISCGRCGKAICSECKAEEKLPGLFCHACVSHVKPFMELRCGKCSACAYDHFPGGKKEKCSFEQMKKSLRRRAG